MHYVTLVVVLISSDLGPIIVIEVVAELAAGAIYSSEQAFTFGTESSVPNVIFCAVTVSLLTVKVK